MFLKSFSVNMYIIAFQLVLYKPQRFQYFSSVPVLHFTGGTFYIPTHSQGAIVQSPCPSISPPVRPSVRFSVRSHIRDRYLSFYWKK